MLTNIRAFTWNLNIWPKTRRLRLPIHTIIYAKKLIMLVKRDAHIYFASSILSGYFHAEVQSITKYIRTKLSTCALFQKTCCINVDNLRLKREFGKQCILRKMYSTRLLPRRMESNAKYIRKNAKFWLSFYAAITTQNSIFAVAGSRSFPVVLARNV